MRSPGTALLAVGLVAVGVAAASTASALGTPAAAAVVVGRPTVPPAVLLGGGLTLAGLVGVAFGALLLAARTA